jgi:hypothetical protein
MSVYLCLGRHLVGWLGPVLRPELDRWQTSFGWKLDLLGQFFAVGAISRR